MHGLPVYRIDVTSSLAATPSKILSEIQALGILRNLRLELSKVYFILGEMAEPELEEIATNLLCDPILERYAVRKVDPDMPYLEKQGLYVVEKTCSHRINDHAGNLLFRLARQSGFNSVEAVVSGTRYAFSGAKLSEEQLKQIAESILTKAGIDRYVIGEIRPESALTAAPEPGIKSVLLQSYPVDDFDALFVDKWPDSTTGELNAIKNFFRVVDRPATSAELAVIAAFWSERVSQKTMSSVIRVTGRQPLDSLLQTFPVMATRRLNPSWVRPAADAFGSVIEFDDDYDLVFKIEPNTRDFASRPLLATDNALSEAVNNVITSGFLPIAVTDILTLSHADPDFHLAVCRRIGSLCSRVGLPPVNGATIFHEGFSSTPAIHTGCIGIGPRGAAAKHPEKGDSVIVIGGPTGRIDEAEFQVGDPLTLKKLIDVVDYARKKRLINAAGHCRAGGLAVAVGLLARNIGARLDLQGLQMENGGISAEDLLLSENDNRIILAVPPENVKALLEICEQFDLEMSGIGDFGSGDSPRLIVGYGESEWVDLPLGFLRSPPRRELFADLPLPKSEALLPLAVEVVQPGPETFPDFLLDLLAHPNMASKAGAMRNFDVEVRGMSVIRPLVGKKLDGPSDAAVLTPQEVGGWRGFSLACGNAVRIGEFDPYAMALISIDEAVRNAVCTGANPRRIALLANYYWGDPESPDTLGRLVEAMRGSFDAALHLGTPFLDTHAVFTKHPVGEHLPGRMLISSIGIHPDIRKAVSMDLKSTGSSLYLIGDWQPFLNGSHLLAILPEPSLGESFPPPKSLPARVNEIYLAFHQAVMAGMVCAAHDLSEGGLAVAAAEMTLAGRLGLELDLSAMHESPFISLFAEAAGCLLVEVSSEDSDSFEMLFAKLPFRRIGIVDVPGSLSISHGGKEVLKMSVSELRKAFNGNS